MVCVHDVLAMYTNDMCSIRIILACPSIVSVRGTCARVYCVTCLVS